MHSNSRSTAPTPIPFDRILVAVAWPTGRPIYGYTPDEIAAGVDVYTRFLKRRNPNATAGEGDAA